MSKKITYIHAENNNKILSSNEVRLYVPPEPEKMKVLIWGKELCNGAEWYDFLKCVEEKTKENDKLKQQLEQANEIINNPNTLIAQQQELIESLNKQLGEKDARIADLEDKDWFEANIKQLEEQNDRLISKLEEKDREIEELKQNNKIFMQLIEETKSKNIDDFAFLVRVTNGSYIQKLRKANRRVQELERLQTQLAIQELEKVKMMTEWKFNSIVDVVEYIDNQIKELKGE